VSVSARIPGIVFVSDSGRSLEEARPGAEGCRGHHVVDHVGKPTGRRRTFEKEYDLFGGEKHGVALKTQRTGLEWRSRRNQLARLIASTFPELSYDDNAIRCRSWPLGGPLSHIHVAIPRFSCDIARAVSPRPTGPRLPGFGHRAISSARIRPDPPLSGEIDPPSAPEKPRPGRRRRERSAAGSGARRGETQNLGGHQLRVVEHRGVAAAGQLSQLRVRKLREESLGVFARQDPIAGRTED
jgi:hypothetical protein